MKNCVTGKPCGKACIPISKTCTKCPTSEGPVCMKGKPCGNTCIKTNYRCSKCGGSATSGSRPFPVVTPDNSSNSSNSSSYTWDTVSSYDEFTVNSGEFFSGYRRPSTPAPACGSTPPVCGSTPAPVCGSTPALICGSTPVCGMTVN